MEKTTPQRSPAEVAVRYEVVIDGVNEFMIKNDLELSGQRMSRIYRHVLSALDARDALTPFMVFNYLQNIFEYNELLVEAMDGDTFSEEALVHLIVSADRRAADGAADFPPMSLKKRAHRALVAAGRARVWKKALAAAVLLCLLALPAFVNSYTTRADVRQEIGVTAASELKGLVARVAAVEGVTTASVWQDVKAHPEVSKHGYRSSYKHFSVAQERAARRYLEARAARHPPQEPRPGDGDAGRG